MLPPWWPLWWPLSWCPIFQWNHCNSFGTDWTHRMWTFWNVSHWLLIKQIVAIKYYRHSCESSAWDTWRIMSVHKWRTVSALTRGSFWCLLDKHQNNTRVGAETVRHESTYTVLFLTRHNESINDDENDDFYISSACLTRSVFVLLMTSQSIADDVAMTRQLWAITWIMISNSLYIDFIHGDIHGRSYNRSYKKFISKAVFY